MYQAGAGPLSNPNLKSHSLVPRPYMASVFRSLKVKVIKNWKGTPSRCQKKTEAKWLPHANNRFFPRSVSLFVEKCWFQQICWIKHVYSNNVTSNICVPDGDLETKAVHSLAFTTLFYLTLILPTIEIRRADSKHVVWAEVATDTSISKLLKFSVPITSGIDFDN